MKNSLFVFASALIFSVSANALPPEYCGKLIPVVKALAQNRDRGRSLNESLATTNSRMTLEVANAIGPGFYNGGRYNSGNTNRDIQTFYRDCLAKQEQSKQQQSASVYTTPGPQIEELPLLGEPGFAPQYNTPPSHGSSNDHSTARLSICVSECNQRCNLTSQGDQELLSACHRNEDDCKARCR